MTTPDDALLDKPGACEYLTITKWHLERLIKFRQIPMVRVGRLIRFRRSELDKWLDDNRVEVE